MVRGIEGIVVHTESQAKLVVANARWQDGPVDGGTPQRVSTKIERLEALEAIKRARLERRDVIGDKMQSLGEPKPAVAPESARLDRRNAQVG